MHARMQTAARCQSKPDRGRSITQMVALGSLNCVIEYRALEPDVHKNNYWSNNFSIGVFLFASSLTFRSEGLFTRLRVPFVSSLML